MRCMTPLAILAILLAGNSSAADCVSAREVSFDTFMNHSLAISIPLDLLIPVEYEHAPLSEEDDYSYWMPPKMVDGVRKTNDLPASTGYLYGKISMDVGYDARTDSFTGGDMDFESSMAAAGIKDVHSQRATRNGHALLFFDGAMMNGRKIYAMYVALNVGSNAIFVSYVPPKNDPVVGDCFWSTFKAAILRSNGRSTTATAAL